MCSNIKQQISTMQKPQLLSHHPEWLLESFRVSETLTPSPFFRIYDNYLTPIVLAYIYTTHLIFINKNNIELPWWLSGKEPACQCLRHWFNLSAGKTPGDGNGNPLQCSYLGNPMHRGAWWATVYGVAKNWHDLATKPCETTNVRMLALFITWCDNQGKFLSISGP